MLARQPLIELVGVIMFDPQAGKQLNGAPQATNFLRILYRDLVSLRLTLRVGQSDSLIHS